MTFSGKKLQDVYDAGALRLVELESTFLSNFKQLQKEHAGELKTKAGECTKQLEQKACDLKAKLTGCADESLNKISKVIASEQQKTEDHSLQLVSELTSLSEQLKATIVALEQTSTQKANYLNLSASDQFMIAFEQAKLIMANESDQGVRQLKKQGVLLRNSLQQKLEQTIWEVRGDEKQVTGTLFKAYMQKTKVIDDHFTGLMEELSDQGNKQSKGLGEVTENSKSEIVQQTKSILERADEQAATIENQIRKFFQEISQQHQEKLDSALAVVADDLSEVHETTAKSMGETAHELGNDLINASTESKESLQNRCQDVKEKINNAMMDLAVRLAERVKLSADLKLSLENERDEIVHGIKAEVAEIKDSFEKKVLDLIAISAERLKDLSNQAAREINEAQKNCDQKLTREGQLTRDEISKEVMRFLELTKKHRLDALEEIARAVGSDEGTAENQPSVLQVDEKDQLENLTN